MWNGNNVDVTGARSIVPCAEPWRSWACTASGMYSQREAVRVVAAIWLRFALKRLKLHRAWMRHAIWVGRIPDEELE